MCQRFRGSGIDPTGPKSAVLSRGEGHGDKENSHAAGGRGSHVHGQFTFAIFQTTDVGKFEVEFTACHRLVDPAAIVVVFHVRRDVVEEIKAQTRCVARAGSRRSPGC